MEFLNPPVNIGELPKIEEVELKPVSPSYLAVLRIELLISSIILLLIAVICIYFIRPLQQPRMILLIAVVWVLLVCFQFYVQQRSFSIMAYAIRDKDILFRRGWLVRKFRTCPFNRIQHSSISSGPLERRYGLSTLILYTAGTDDSDVRIAGLLASEALTLKEWINKKVTDES
jgi:membrane protein YdbS with pleckstrin-like domain